MEEKEEYKTLNINSTLYKTRLSKKFENRKPFKPADPCLVRSFIPGTVVDVLVKEGSELKHGDVVIILDAMKMQNRLKTHVDGRVKRINVKSGDRVTKGAVLLEMERVAGPEAEDSEES
ncbi:MAG TPA: acetyl-CoA carboxylase biotin carboxyl carrier protein subunit [Bacteroidales bacterium]|nr:acetyl-CoA carboxylase biotin carboxyl carrier protein subunit [Bacteroidales bacterium]HRR93031.1 acetyl-CoA carboxylase biotin carboxyl carrier protein subunit [Bacteroidales bacterium]HRT90524.1 acetyl-CoA carboxylase biotin carboxyl carrier protein subunit [Bacteroidales bacterium]